MTSWLPLPASKRSSTRPRNRVRPRQKGLPPFERQCQSQISGSNGLGNWVSLDVDWPPIRRAFDNRTHFCLQGATMDRPGGVDLRQKGMTSCSPRRRSTPPQFLDIRLHHSVVACSPTLSDQRHMICPALRAWRPPLRGRALWRLRATEPGFAYLGPAGFRSLTRDPDGSLADIACGRWRGPVPAKRCGRRFPLGPSRRAASRPVARLLH
jgi:hypothetical protein